jgi:hypothetical protein
MPRADSIRTDATTFYQCRRCGRVILHRLPRLQGEFAHFRCERGELALGGGDILNAEFLTLSRRPEAAPE